MIALELNAILIANDGNVIEKAKELGVNTISLEQFLASSSES